MSGFGVFEVDEYGDDSRLARTAAHRRAVDTATHYARREFGAYLANARSANEWNDRLSQVIVDMSELVEKHASLSDLDKVVASLRSEAEGRHFNPAEPVDDGYGLSWSPGKNPGQELLGNPGAWNSWGYIDPNKGEAGYFPTDESDREGHHPAKVEIDGNGLNPDQLRAEVEKAYGDEWGEGFGGTGRHRAAIDSTWVGDPLTDVNERLSQDPALQHQQILHDEDPYYNDDLYGADQQQGEFPVVPRTAVRTAGDDDADAASDPEGFDNQELLDDWPLPDNPVDDAFDGDENDLESADSPLQTGGSDSGDDEMDLSIEITSNRKLPFPVVPRVAPKA